MSKTVYSLMCALSFCSAASLAESGDADIDIENFLNETFAACAADAVTLCGDINPGEGRLGQCLRDNLDSLSEQCSDAVEALAIAIEVYPDRFSNTFPSLQGRDLGEPLMDESGDTPVWGRRLPFLAQKVIELGFDLPNPYGVAVIPAWIEQDLILENLEISVNGGTAREIDFVDFGVPSVRNTTVQLKLDAWILPFLSLYATVGTLDGEGTIPLSISGADLFPTLCSLTPNAAICSDTLTAIAEPKYHGDNISLGMNLAMGWKEFFVTVPITYAWTDVNIIDTTVTALNISPRIGVTGEVGEHGMIAAFIGATYLDAEVDLTGQVSFDTPGGPSGDITTIDYTIRQRNKDKWNYLLGFNWDINKNWSLTAEAGFGGSRSNIIAGATFRF